MGIHIFSFLLCIMCMKTIKYNINMDENMKKKFLGWVYYIYENLFLKN